MTRSFRFSLAAALLLAVFSGCGGVGPEAYRWFDGPNPEPMPGTSSLRVRWSERLTEAWGGAYTPVEHAAIGLDPRRGRVFVGVSEGGLYGFDVNGRKLFRYDTESGVEAAPAVDPAWGEVFAVGEDGRIHALDGATGEARWVAEAGAPVRQPPVLAEDAVYVVTESDTIVAVSRSEGEVLWTYSREIDTEHAIVGHAGLLLHEQVLYTGLTDGTVVAVNASDGRMRWELQTILDAEPAEGDAMRFYDADATPVLSEDGNSLYVASFLTGIYALDPQSGTVQWRDEMEGVTGLASSGPFLFVSASGEGLLALDRETRERVWQRRPEHGAAGVPTLTGTNVLLMAESQGSLFALDARTGVENARLDTGFGFSSVPSVAGELGFVLSNGGTLIAFSL